jgi:hypothetical protein
VRTASVGVILASVFLWPCETRATEYVAEIQQVDGIAGGAVALRCPDETAHPCSEVINLAVSGKSVAVSVFAWFKQGDVYFRFYSGDTELLAGAEPYAHLSLSDLSPSSQSFDLAIPTAVVKEDAPNALYHRPVVRGLPAFATIQINVHPSNRRDQ